MLNRLIVRDNEQPEAARRRFDSQLHVPNWGTPAQQRSDPPPAETAAPWWWDKKQAEQSTDFFMQMARERGMVE